VRLRQAGFAVERLLGDAEDAAGEVGKGEAT